MRVGNVYMFQRWFGPDSDWRKSIRQLLPKVVRETVPARPPFQVTQLVWFGFQLIAVGGDGKCVDDIRDMT